jgi:hypothetical protein
MRRLAFIVVLVAFVFSCGGQWPLLQGVAWANMIRQYTEMVPLAQAVQMTFSGKYPCPLCRAIAEKRQSEDNKIAALFKHEKKLFSPGLTVDTPQMIPSPQTYAVWEPVFQTRSEAPPTPPPRFAEPSLA